jgi:hypothetical protein
MRTLADGATILDLLMERQSFSLKYLDWDTKAEDFQSNCIASSDEVTTASFFELALASTFFRDEFFLEDQ